MKYWKICMIPILLITLSVSGFGGTTGKITGQVTDKSSEEPLVGANVILKGTSIGAASNIEGEFLILNISPGTYDLEISMIGYQKQLLTDVIVQIDLTSRINIELSSTVLEAGESVTVIAERPVIQRDKTSSESRVSSDEIEALPVNEMRDLLEMQSGVTVDAGGGIHIRGGRSSEVAYWVDGIPVTDAYDGSQSVTIENDAIQELQVISGTFNAEYGNAMSGIINIVTKEGAAEYKGSISAYLGDYISKDKKLYPNIDKINPFNENNLQVNFEGPVPFFKDKISFYTSIRKVYTDGWLYGTSYFNMYGDTLDDAKEVPMNWRDQFTTNSKITFKPFAKLKFRLSYMTSVETYEMYNHYLQYVPESNMENYDLGRNISLGMTHTLSERTFYELKFSSAYSYYHSWLFEDENDPGYIDPNFWDHLERVNPYYWFTDYNINTTRFERFTNTNIAKLDFTSQIDNLNLIKFGFEAKQHISSIDAYAITDDLDIRDSVFTPYIPQKDVAGKKFGDFYRYSFTVKPEEYSVYVQDKLEFQSVIINLGLRWDYFNANGYIPADPTEPYIDNPRDPALDSLTLQEKEAIWWKKTTSKQQVSPRLGIAYPITDKGVIHFSFGHFFQIPQYELLYANPGYKIPETSGTFGIYGNPDMRPQKTVMYELGINQEIVQDLIIDMTGFYRDVRDWVSTGVPIDIGGGAQYITYENKDYSNVRGIVLSVDKKYHQSYWFNISYTFQIAEGSNSDPGDAFGAIAANREPRKYIVPLNWDQRHTLNGSFYYGNTKWGATLNGRFGSGYPYTPVVTSASRQGSNVSIQPETNSRRVSPTYEFDLKLHRKFELFGTEITAYVDIFNLLDTRNEIYVWGSTGRTDSSIEELQADETSRNYLAGQRINTVEEYFDHSEWYYAPRKINIGLKISF